MAELFATAPPEFVAARNALVKSLRAAKRRDDATAIAALRRPTWDEWALNAVADSDPEVVAVFADAAGAVRDAQTAAIEGRDGPDIRSSLRELRDASVELVRQAEAALVAAGRTVVAGEVNTRLSQVAGSDAAVVLLRAGLLGSGVAETDELFGDLQIAPRSPASPRRSSRVVADVTAAAPVDDPPAASAAPAIDPAAARAARADEQRRKEALVEANRRHAAAVKARHRADAEVEKAEATVARARAALDVAKGALDDATAARVSALDDERAAGAAVDAARAAVDARHVG